VLVKQPRKQVFAPYTTISLDRIGRHGISSRRCRRGG
jgi:hypothetical protein